MRTTVATCIQKYRAGMRASGLRPVQIWVPDIQSSDFADECRRQSLALRDDMREADTLKWLEASADTTGWK